MRRVAVSPVVSLLLLVVLACVTSGVHCGNIHPVWELPPYVHVSTNYSTRIIDPVELEAPILQSFDRLMRQDGLPQQQQQLDPRLRQQQQQQQQQDAGSSSKKPRALLAVTTSNVWDRTQGMLLSLANVPDAYDLFVIDECSSDATREELAKLPNVKLVLVNETKGVTYHWNQAYQHFLDNGYDYLFISNNDVLIPPGVLTKLSAALEDGTCDLVSPLSTLNGKGHIGIMEGIEMVFNMTEPAVKRAMNPFNYARTQLALDGVFGPGDQQVFARRGDYNGFFFGVSRRISRAAAGPRALFSEQLFSFRQEHDLSGRMDDQGMKRCLHVGTFVFHYKASTIPAGHLHVRETYKAACEVFEEQQQRKLQEAEQQQQQQQQHEERRHHMSRTHQRGSGDGNARK